MKLKPLAPLILACVLGMLPALALGGPWDPNLRRPPGFQRTLAYLGEHFYDYPSSQLQPILSGIVNEDIVAVTVTALRNSGIPPERWEQEGQKAYDSYLAQYEALKNIIRQTMTDPEGLISAVEASQPLAGTLLDHPNAIALIALRWQMIAVGERTLQALLYIRGEMGSGGRPGPPTDIGPPKPGKGKPGLDWERMRESRRRAIERRKAFEEHWAREAARRQAELNLLIEQLIGLRPKSSSKFQTRPTGGYVTPAATEQEPTAAAPDQGPPPTIEEIEKIEEEIAEAEEKMEEEPAAAKEPAAKVTVYRGTLILRRVPGWSDETWQTIKQIFKDALAKPPGTTDMNDKGDEITWRYKLLEPGGYPFKHPMLQDIPDAETTEEEAEENKKEEEPEPTFTGNGDADPTDEKVVPGTEKKPAKPAPKPAPKPEPKAESKAVPGYWYDPTDMSRSSKEKFIYVRVDGESVRVPLDEATDYGVPAGATLDTMTWYSERTGKIVPGKDRGTHRGPDQPKSSNKFAKPKG